MPTSDVKEPPVTGLRDLARLGVRLTLALLRHPLEVNAESVFRHWAKLTANRLNSNDLMINFLVKKLLLVGSSELSRQILATPPSQALFSAGLLKRSGMAFLAAHALTISDDQAWVRRRSFNESVLEPDRRHPMASSFVQTTVLAFTPTPTSIADLQAAMGRAMVGVVFGGQAQPSLVGDIETLYSLVQNPLKRLLLAPYAHFKRRRLYDALRVLWHDQRAATSESLLSMAGGAEQTLSDQEVLEQVPHWMFTFTGSATALLTRTLALISAFPAVHGQAMAELAAAGPIAGSSFDPENLPYLEACLWEAAYCYPPVTKTFHRVAEEVTVGDVRIPPGTEIMHLFPLFTSDSSDKSRRFNPNRWLCDVPPVYSFDPFLGGARRCPGQRLILLICKTALATLLTEHRAGVVAPGIGAGPLPAEFPQRDIQILQCCRRRPRDQSKVSSPVGS